MDDIFLFQSDQRSAATLAAALESRYRVRTFASFGDLEGWLPSSRPRACLLDVFHPQPALTLAALRRFRTENRSMALVVASDFSEKEMDLYHLGRLSVDGVIRLEDQPDRRAIRNAVNRAIASALAGRVIAAARNTLPPLGQEILRWSIEHAEARPQVSELAAALAMSPRVLRREMSDRGLPNPRAFLLWGRLVRAIDLLERPGETVEGVALQLGYATGGALRKALRRHTGMSPTALLAKGGLGWTLKMFLRDGLFLPTGKGSRRR